MKICRLILPCLLAAGPLLAKAEIKFAPIFTDNMVLQRDTKVPVWGTATAGEQVNVTLTNQKQHAVADAQGHWQVAFAPLTADGQPLTLAVEGSSLALKNILAGDVWLCSGQSNMLYPLDHCSTAKEEIPKANNPTIRVINYNYVAYPKDSEYAQNKIWESIWLSKQVPSLADELAKHQAWAALSPDNAGFCSGVAYYFAHDLYAAQKVPIGIILCAVGAQTVQTFISPEGYKKDPALASMVPLLTKQNEGRVKQFEEARDKWKADIEKAGTQDKVKPGDAPAPARLNEMSWIYNDIVSGIVPFAIKGVLWYQGESNGPVEYRTLFPALIRDWRRQWGRGDFPFFFVQLPNFGKPPVDAKESAAPGRADMREAQTLALTEPATAMAVVIDQPNDTDLHPRNKEPVGHRLSLLARNRVYGEKIVADGPVFDSAIAEGNKVRIKFKQLGGGLVLSSGDQPLGFAIAGADKSFVWATAAIDGDSIVLSSDSVLAPKFIRYAWVNNPPGNIGNREGLPLAPFQTELK